MRAARKGHKTIVKMLIDAGADLEDFDIVRWRSLNVDVVSPNSVSTIIE